MTDTQVRTCCSPGDHLDTVRDVPKEPMKSRNVRVGDRLWTDALETAERNGDNLADVIRAFLAWYVRERGAQLPERPPRA